MRWVVVGLALTCASSAWAHEPINRDILEVSDALEAGGPVVDLLVVRARLWLLDDEPERALADLRLAEALEPDNLQLPIVRAAALRAVGRIDEALAVLESAVPTFGGHRLQGEIHEEAGRLVEALSHYESAAATTTTVDVCLARGRVLRALGRGADAIGVYQVALPALNGAVVVRRELVAALVRAGRHDEALAQIDAARADAADTSLWDLREAAVREARGEHARADSIREGVLHRLSERLVRRPTAARWLQRARAERELGRVEDARRSVRRALSLAPRYAPALELQREIDS